MTLDLSTARGALAFAARQREEMRRDFDRLGRFERKGYSFASFAFATHDIAAAPGQPIPFRTGDKLPAVKAVPVMLPAMASAILPHREHTAAFAHITREFCKMTRAIGTLLMSEAWLGHLDLGKDSSQEERDAARAARPESLEDWDDRREALVMSLEHAAAGRHFWSARIERRPTVLSPWSEMNLDDAEGRLVNLSEFRS